jgi:hypothetical protein
MSNICERSFLIRSRVVISDVRNGACGLLFGDVNPFGHLPVIIVPNFGLGGKSLSSFFIALSIFFWSIA